MKKHRMREEIVMRKISPQSLEEIIDLDVVNRGGHSVIDGTPREETLFKLWARAKDSECGRLNTPPHWIKDTFTWGAHSWPISISRVLPQGSEKPLIDCGAYQDVATRVMKQRGAEVYPVQVFLQFPRYITQAWRDMWESRNLEFHWGNETVVYRELTGIVSPKNNQVRLYDPAEALYPFQISTSTTSSAMIGLRICSSYGEEFKNVGKKILLCDSSGKQHQGIEIDQWYHVFNNIQ